MLFGGMSVGLRLGLNRRPDAALATLATVVGAFAVSVVFAAAESPSRGWHLGPAWPFLLAGILQPELGQLVAQRAQEVELLGGARVALRIGVGLGVEGHVAEEPPSGVLCELGEDVRSHGASVVVVGLAPWRLSDWR